MIETVRLKCTECNAEWLSSVKFAPEAEYTTTDVCSRCGTRDSFNNFHTHYLSTKMSEAGTHCIKCIKCGKETQTTNENEGSANSSFRVEGWIDVKEGKWLCPLCVLKFCMQVFHSQKGE